MKILVSNDAGTRRLERTTSKNADFTAHFAFVGLRPDTEYTYRIRGEEGRYTFRTAGPAPPGRWCR